MPSVSGGVQKTKNKTDRTSRQTRQCACGYGHFLTHTYIHTYITRGRGIGQLRCRDKVWCIAEDKAHPPGPDLVRIRWWEAGEAGAVCLCGHVESEWGKCVMYVALNRGPSTGNRRLVPATGQVRALNGEGDAEVEGYLRVIGTSPSSEDAAASRSPGRWSRYLRWAWPRRAKGAGQTGGLVEFQRGCTVGAARGAPHD